MTESFSVKLRVANMIFPNKTVIVVTKHHTSQQQIILLVGMAFIGGIAAGFLIRCIYYGIVKFFMKSMDDFAVEGSQRPNRGNVNLSFVGDITQANDEPPDYITVMADTSQYEPPLQENGIKSCKELTGLKTEELPPCYLSVVPYLGRSLRSASA